MGVPKFYRWISERYPCLSEVVKDYQIPEFDNLYLDMNGVIHVCSHPEDDNPHFRITEEKIMQDIFHYIEVLFRMIKPRKVFFMAVDGVAPRAKMNQQRGRRFRSAREAEDLVKKAVEKGETLPTEARFDSNCITPGTEFMVRLHEQLQYFVVKKVSTDSLWQGVRIILSGHETPGEGEHKVMDFIRYEKSQPDYDPNTRHCLYGLDADLIMLGLSSHEPHFSLLREEVKFGKKAQKRISTVEETTFHLLHLSLMREYIDYEFDSLKDKLPFGYNLENIIDDWVLMGFLVGNDFIPHLPDLHIHHDALPLLWKTYKKVLPTLNGYLNNGGELNLENFEKYLRVLAKVDFDNFTEKHADLKWLESRAECRNANKHHALTSDEVGIPTADEFMQNKNEDSADDNFSAFQKQDFDAMLAEFDFSEEEEDDSEDEERNTFDEQFFTDFRNFKADYYRDKLEFQDVNQEVLKDQALGYVKAVQWILYYYFKGVPSWSWYYPHHYAPYLSDVRDFSNMKMEFEFSKPFLPFQQLMAVLPAASKNLMPAPLQSLMLSENSPVKDYYPVDFKTDLNGKQQPWEAVVLIPFIDENRLISAMTPLEDKLTDEEKSRNKHGPHIMFEYVAESQGTYTSTMFPDVYNHHAKITYLPLDQFWMRDKSMLRQGLCPGVRLDVYFPGFPTMKHIPHKAELQRCSVRVFQHVSKGENMMLTITKEIKQPIKDIAEDLIGRSIYVSWPHLSEAQVIAVSNGEIKYYWLKEKSTQSSEKGKVVIECNMLTEEESNIWSKEVHRIAEEYQNRKGVFVGKTEVLVYACPLAGNRYVYSHHGDVILEKQWSASSYAYALQATVKDISVKDPTYRQFKTLVDLFSPKSDVFMLGEPKYGCKGEVIDVDVKNVRIRVDFTVLQEPDLGAIQSQSQNYKKYFPGYQLARRLGLSSLMLSRITGCIFVIKSSPDAQKKPEHSDRMNIGLNLKLNKSNQEVPGYTKKGDNEWLYSDALEKTIHDYITEFPELFDYISQNSNENTYYADHIFGKDRSKTRLQDLSKFLKQLHCNKVQPVPQGSAILDELVVMEIEKQVEQVKEVNRKRKRHIKMQVRPHLLFRPLEAQLTLVPDPSTTYRLFDRIVNVRQGFSVPLGLRGTIIGITNAEKECDVLYDVVFDESFLGGLTLRCSPGRGYRMPSTAMINLSHGERKSAGAMAPINKPTAVVKPQSSANTYAEAAVGGAGRQTQHHLAKTRARYNNTNRFCDVLETRLQNSHQARPQRFGMPQQQVDTQQCQNQGHHEGRRQQAMPSEQSQDEFTDLWKQLQKAQRGKRSEVAGQSSGTSSANREASERNQMPRQERYTLENAASALKSSFQQEPQTADTRNPKSKAQDQTQAQAAIHKIDIDSLMNSDNNIVKFVPSKSQLKHRTGIEEQLSADPDLSKDGMLTQQERDQRQEHPDIQKGRAVLCQMLNIIPESSEKPEAKGQVGVDQDGGTADNLKHISVQQLFAIAKQHNQQQEVNIQTHPKGPGRDNKKSAVELLAEWCQTVGMPQPKYDYQLGRDNKQRAVITLANGQRFSGCYTQNTDQAAELAAGIALTKLHQAPGGPSRYAYQQGPLQPHQGPKHLSTSPNSAFTPVKPLSHGLAQNQLQPFPGWQQRPNAPFPAAPPFGLMAALQHMGRVRGPYQPPPAQKGQRFQQPNWPQQRASWPQQPQQQTRPQPPPNWPHHQAQHNQLQQQLQEQQHPQAWATRQVKDHGARSHQPGIGAKEHGPGTRSTTNQSTISQQDASTKGASAFIPLQVMQKQKTPQKPTKELSENQTELPSGESGELQQQTGDTKSSSQRSFTENIKPQNQSSDNRAESADSAGPERTAARCNKTSKSSVTLSSTTSGSMKPSGGGVLHPSRRPKSRLAAKFSAAN